MVEYEEMYGMEDENFDNIRYSQEVMNTLSHIIIANTEIKLKVESNEM